MTRADRIASWLRERAENAGAKGFVFGLSGGIDSAVVARLCQLATPGNVLGVLLPCYSQPQDEQDAMLVADAFKMPTVRVDLSRAFDALGGALDDALKAQQPKIAVNVVDIKQRLPRANIKPRLRMTSLYYIANAMNYVVAGTGNRSEITLGYYTKYGDGGVDVLPIGGLLKSEVRALARELGVEAATDPASLAGRCDAYTTDASGLASIRSREAKNPKDHVILPDLISKEPLGPMVRKGDEEWLSVVRWTVYGLIEAEELGVRSDNLNKVLGESTDPAVLRLLGKGEDLGKMLGLDKEWLARAIGAVGNYGEIYERHVGEKTPVGLKRGVNALWTQGGLMYALPLR